MPDIIYHLCRQPDWNSCRDDEGYVGSDTATADGFLHASTAAQVIKSAKLHMAGFDDLLVIEIDASLLGKRLKWEHSRSGALFPHIYGALPDTAILGQHHLALTDDGYDFSALPAILDAGEQL